MRLAGLSSQGTDVDEMEANLFAAELLMPQVWLVYKKKKFLNFTVIILITNRGESVEDSVGDVSGLYYSTLSSRAVKEIRSPSLDLII